MQLLMSDKFMLVSVMRLNGGEGSIRNDCEMMVLYKVRFEGEGGPEYFKVVISMNFYRNIYF